MQLFDIVSPWIKWVEAALLSIVLIICAIQPRSVVRSIQALSSSIQRRYVSGSNGGMVWLLRALFQMGTISLALLVAVAAYVDQQALTLAHYGLAIGMVAVIVLIKALLDKWIQFTFRYAMNERTYYAFRGELWQIISILLWVMLLFAPYMEGVWQWLIPMVIFGTYFIVLWWKIMQVFGWEIIHIGYSTLYIVHVEILPLMAAIVSINKILS